MLQPQIRNALKHLFDEECGLVSYHANDPTPAQLAINSDDKLFSSVLTNSHHMLKQLLPDETSHQYNLRSRRHNLSLSVKTDDRNFIIRQLFRDSY